MSIATESLIIPGIGTDAQRPDGVAKVSGDFAYASDLWMPDLLRGATLRSPHPRARIRRIDTAAALRHAGVRAVLTVDDVPGRRTFGLLTPDQPVLADTEVRYVGEPVAIVAADDMERARAAVEQILVDYEPLVPVVDPMSALAPGASMVHPAGNLLRHFRLRRGQQRQDDDDVVVHGTYTVGTQDQAALGLESGLAFPTRDGGIEVQAPTQWAHEDRAQLAASLALPIDRVRVVVAGIGGAFGAREDLSVQLHCALLAQATGRPVKMVLSREESFVGHVHRHPARMEYEHRATRDGRLTSVTARIVLDGGAYASTSPKVAGNAGAFATGPYAVNRVHVDVFAVRTNNPPNGAMRGFGATQVCFGHEAQMNRLAAALGVDPLELRSRNALQSGDVAATGQTLRGVVAVTEIVDRLATMPLPAATMVSGLRRPGGTGNTTRGEGVVRGIGYALGMKAFCFTEGFDDTAEARVTLREGEQGPVVEVRSAASEVGQGISTVQVQVAHSELAVATVVLLPADTTVGSAGSSSASRQTAMTGGAVRDACIAVRRELFARARSAGLTGHLTLDAAGVHAEGGARLPVQSLVEEGPIEHTAVHRHRETTPLDPATGQGDAFVSFMFVGHRAVVDVDAELGLVRVVDLGTVQDVGLALNPQAIEGQIEGGSAQGLGLALMEEVQLDEGRVRNASFTDYLIPTAMDMPRVRSVILEHPDPDAAYGVKGAGEPPTISSGAAVVAAVEQAIGHPLPQVPVRPEHIVAARLATAGDRLTR